MVKLYIYNMYLLYIFERRILMNKNNLEETDRDSSTSSIASVNYNNTATLQLSDESGADGFTIGTLKVHATNSDKSNMVTMATNINVTQV